MFDKATMDQIVSAAVVNVLEEQAVPLLKELVDKIVNEKVDTRGQPSSYGASQSRLEYIAKQELEMVVSQAVRDWIKEKSTSLKDVVKARLDEGGLADAFVDTLVRQMSSDYNVRFNVNLSLPRDAD